jgi:hypothetical protein
MAGTKLVALFVALIYSSATGLVDTCELANPSFLHRLSCPEYVMVARLL